MDNRIVVTGIGVVSSLGIGRKKFWDALISGASGINEVDSFDTTGYLTHRGGEVKDFNARDFIDGQKADSMGRASCFAIAAAKLALEDAGASNDVRRPIRTGVILGTTMAETQIVEMLNNELVKKGTDAVDARFVPLAPANVISAHVAIELKCKGPNLVIPTACAAGNYAIGYAYDLLRRNEADMMLAGGVDAFSRIAFTGFNRLFAVAPDKCQPFDKNRKGMIVGEGSGMVVLERLEGALKRKAPVYAEILGYGLSCDAFHMTQPEPSGIARVLENALKASGVCADNVDYINAHGTGTVTNDKVECLAIKKVFGERARSLPVSSIKSMLGHTMGAASAIEAIACCLAVQNDLIPPTINYETPDPECDIDCVPNTARSQRVDIALNNSSAFGGNNACLVIKKFSA